ncbi:hypothetical protein Tco_1035872 [Tanacetum coccineum]
MDDLVQDFFIRPEGNTFDLDVYETYTNLFTIKCHYYGKFNDGPKKEYIEGETCFVDLVNRDQFTDVVLNTVINSLGYEMEDEVLYWYKIPLKSLDVGLKPLVSESDYRSFLGYVEKHKVMDVYVEIVEKNEESDSGSDSDKDVSTGNDGNDPIAPKVNLTEDNIEVLDFDSLESDLEDVPENDRRDVAKDLIRTHAVESRRNLHFLRNDPIRIRVVCNGVVPCKNLVTYKVPGPNVDNAVKGKIVNEDAEEDKITCPWLLYLSKGDKGKWFIKTFKDEHHCLQSRKIKYCTSTFLSKHITDLIIMNPNMPIKAIQEQMQKKFHVAVSRDKAFRAKAKATVSLRGDVKIQYALLRDYVMELKRCNPDTTVKIDVYGEEIVMVKGNKLTRQGKTITCSLCHAAGHNKRSCDKRQPSQGGTSTAAGVGTQPSEASQGGTSNAAGTNRKSKGSTGTSNAATQASTGSPLKRTKKSASRLTPEK